jgi:hypothetical protein
MTTLLSIAARPDAPIACDMTAAEDTLAGRLAEYRRLFDHALVARDSTATTTTFRLAARPGVRDWALDLARREAACCPFLSYRVEEVGDEIVWTASGGLGASQMSVLDEYLASSYPPANTPRQEDSGSVSGRLAR